jgi:DUF4097 and DUF4098 domain-containing protein YvlB
MTHATWQLVAAFGVGAGMFFATGARAAARIEKHLNLSPGGRFVLDSEIGMVTVRGDSSAGVKAVITADSDKFEQDFDVRFEEHAGEVKLTVVRRGEWPHWLSWTGIRGGVQFAISVPHATTVSVRTSGGRITATELDGGADLASSGGGIRVQQVVGQVRARTSGGAVEVRDVRGSVHLQSSGGNLSGANIAGAVEGDTSGGDIDLDRITGDIRVEAAGGGIHIRAAAGKVNATTAGGPVDVAFAAGNALGGKLSSAGGGVKVWLDPSVHLDLEASAAGGSVSCDLPISVQGRHSRSKIAGVLNGGGEKLSIHSSGGGVRVGALAKG